MVVLCQEIKKRLERKRSCPDRIVPFCRPVLEQRTQFRVPLSEMLDELLGATGTILLPRRAASRGQCWLCAQSRRSGRRP